MGSPRKAARVIIVVFALSFISSLYVADRVMWHSSLESIGSCDLCHISLLPLWF